MVGHIIRQMDSRLFLENWTTIGASYFCQCTSFCQLHSIRTSNFVPCHLCSSSFFGIQGHVLPHRQANCKRIGHIHPPGALGTVGLDKPGFSSLKSSSPQRLCIKNIHLPSNFGEGESLVTWIFDKKTPIRNQKTYSRKIWLPFFLGSPTKIATFCQKTPERL